jgi:hypothetical protein
VSAEDARDLEHDETPPSLQPAENREKRWERERNGSPRETALLALVRYPPALRATGVGVLRLAHGEADRHAGHLEVVAQAIDQEAQ